jgi:hypothetical protein
VKWKIYSIQDVKVCGRMKDHVKYEFSNDGIKLKSAGA